MLTLEKVKQPTQTLTISTKLICYEKYYGFLRTYPYHIHDITTEGDYIILDCDKRPVIFTRDMIRKYFMIR